MEATIIYNISETYIHVSYGQRMPGSLAWQRPNHGDACQSGKTATQSNELFFGFNISLLNNYLVKYYDYIVKWCSGIACNWGVLLDIDLILALVSMMCERDTDILMV